MKWKFWRNIENVVDPNIGKTIVHFISHGCMAEQHEFDYIGTIVEVTTRKNCGNLKFYKVEVWKKGSSESIERQYEYVAAHYIQNIGGGALVAYD